MKVLVVGKQDRRVMLALAALEAEVVAVDTLEIRPREFTGVWLDEMTLPAPAPSRRYGPPARGRGGKVKRW